MDWIILLLALSQSKIERLALFPNPATTRHPPAGKLRIAIFAKPKAKLF
jgi:hypothetical protein